MSKYLVIVESPAKAKTINKYLGKDYTVLASFGHVRDLLAKNGSVDTENNFAMSYQLIDKNKKHFTKILQTAQKSEKVYLATDPDREGEAISWHILELLKEKISDLKYTRVAFFEITKNAIIKAMDNPRDVSMDLVNSQQARRALDYLVGFNLSPLLWEKIKRGLSAGRVQSPALKMIVEREDAILKFKTKEYWSIIAQTQKDSQKFEAKLSVFDNEKLTQFSINNEKKATEINEKLIKDANGSLKVIKIEQKERKRNPSPPFITSTLQQEAARKLGYSAKKTMMLAQQLYEGIDGNDGFITYMRTDSVHLGQEAIESIRDYISNNFGKKNLPAKSRVFKSKSKNAQEAHEAIRPTNVLNEPTQIKNLDKDQLRLYTLIWKRTVASQMSHCVIAIVSIDLAAKNNIFHTTGSFIKTPGFISLYMEGMDDQKQEEFDNNLPKLSEGETVELENIIPKQHFTEPPPRFTEASLVKNLEKHDIGRPSTYASIIATLQAREYVEVEQKKFKPTDMGVVVNKFLSKYFNKYVDYDFTANLEDKLDSVARGEAGHLPILEEFWSDFTNTIKTTKENVSREEFTTEKIDEYCPKCKAQLYIKLGRNGKFVGCTNYPECDFTKDLQEQEVETLDRNCPKCESQLQYKIGRYGKFIGCTNYPDCKHIESLNPAKKLDITCPTCEKGSMMQKRSRRGKIFFACDKYPSCKYALWNEPVSKTCPQCKWPILTLKTTQKNGDEYICPQEECDFKESIS